MLVKFLLFMTSLNIVFALGNETLVFTLDEKNGCTPSEQEVTFSVNGTLNLIVKKFDFEDNANCSSYANTISPKFTKKDGFTAIAQINITSEDKGQWTCRFFLIKYNGNLTTTPSNLMKSAVNDCNFTVKLTGLLTKTTVVTTTASSPLFSSTAGLESNKTTNPKKDDDNMMYIIIGASVGGVLVAAIIIAQTIVICRMSKAKSTRNLERLNSVKTQMRREDPKATGALQVQNRYSTMPVRKDSRKRSHTTSAIYESVENINTAIVGGPVDIKNRAPMPLPTNGNESDDDGIYEDGRTLSMIFDYPPPPSLDTLPRSKGKQAPRPIPKPARQMDDDDEYEYTDVDITSCNASNPLIKNQVPMHTRAGPIQGPSSRYPSPSPGRHHAYPSRPSPTGPQGYPSRGPPSRHGPSNPGPSNYPGVSNPPGPASYPKPSPPGPSHPGFPGRPVVPSPLGQGVPAAPVLNELGNILKKRNQSIDAGTPVTRKPGLQQSPSQSPQARGHKDFRGPPGPGVRDTKPAPKPWQQPKLTPKPAWSQDRPQPPRYPQSDDDALENRQANARRYPENPFGIRMREIEEQRMQQDYKKNQMRSPPLTNRAVDARAPPPVISKKPPAVPGKPSLDGSKPKLSKRPLPPPPDEVYEPVAETDTDDEDWQIEELPELNFNIYNV